MFPQSMIPIKLCKVTSQNIIINQSCTTKIVVADASEMLVCVYQTAQPHIPEDHLTALLF
jgi:hypothetical protein